MWKDMVLMSLFVAAVIAAYYCLDRIMAPPLWCRQAASSSRKSLSAVNHALGRWNWKIGGGWGFLWIILILRHGSIHSYDNSSNRHHLSPSWNPPPPHVIVLWNVWLVFILYAMVVGVSRWPPPHRHKKLLIVHRRMTRRLNAPINNCNSVTNRPIILLCKGGN